MRPSPALPERRPASPPTSNRPPAQKPHENQTGLTHSGQPHFALALCPPPPAPPHPRIPAAPAAARGLLTSGTLRASPSALGLDVTSLLEPSQPRGQVGPTLKSGTCVLSHLFPAPSLPGQSWISAVTSQSAFPEAPLRCPGCTPLRPFVSLGRTAPQHGADHTTGS